MAFNKVAIGPRGSKPPIEALDQAARRLENLFGEQVLPLEDIISKSARKHLPLVVEEVGSLPDRLRLLGLPGEERARNLLGQLTEILRGDASDAPARLGLKSTELEDDILWARAAEEALDEGGEDDVREANELLNGLAELSQMFPFHETLGTDNGAITNLEAILKSVRFHEQLADLRSINRKLKGELRKRYAATWQNYDDGLQGAKQFLENMAEWELIIDDDRIDLAVQLNQTMPQDPDDDYLLSTYRTLLARVNGVAQMREQLAEKVAARVPKESGGQLIKDGDDEPVSVNLRSHFAEQIIADRNQLDGWVSDLRQPIEQELKTGHKVRIEI